MKEGWEYKKLGEIAEIKGGKRLPKGVKLLTTPTKHPYIRVADFNDRGTIETNDIHYISDSVYEQIKRYIIKKEDVYISIAGTIGKSGVIPVFLDGANLTENACRLILSNNLYQRFVYYYTISPSFIKQIVERTKKSAQPKLALTRLSDVIISYPPLSEQQSIVDYLDSAFAKIDAMKANAGKALNEAKALFQASLKEMLEPKEGWEEKTLKELCKVINGRTYSKDEMLKKGKYRLLRVGNFFTNDSWYYSDLELEDDKYCDNGDLLYAWSASFGPRIWDGEKVIYHYHIWKMVCSAEIDKFFLCYWLDSDELKKHTMTNLHGATMAHITKGIIEAARVGFPSLSEQQSIVATLDSLKSKVDRLQENFDKISQECDALKQAILREVFE